MRIIGKILVLVASIFFLVDFVNFCFRLPETIATAQAYSSTWGWDMFIAWATVVILCLIRLTYLLGAIGGIFFFFGLGFFRKRVKNLVVILVISWIIMLIPTLYTMVTGVTGVSTFFSALAPASIANILYVIGYLMGRKAID